MLTGLPVAGFHNRTMPLSPTVARSLPSGLTPPRPRGHWGRSRRQGHADEVAGDRVSQPRQCSPVWTGLVVTWLVTGLGKELNADRCRGRTIGATCSSGSWSDQVTKLLGQGLDQVLAVVADLGNEMIKVTAPAIRSASTDP